MRALAGYMLFVAALAFGAVEFYLEPADREAFIGALSRTFNPPAAAEARARPKRSPASRVFSPPSPLFETAVDDATAAPAIGAPRQQNSSVLAAKRAPPSPGGWSTVVVMERRPSGRDVQHAEGGDHYALALALQKELRRVGCYGGQLHGSWSSGSKDAMSEFVKRVNAALPFDRPDDALLNLVRGHSGLVCGAECPRGHVMARGGRCLPSAVIARAPDASGAATTAEAVMPPAPRPALPHTRMTLGGPPPERGGADAAPADAPPEVATGYLDPTAATTQIDQDAPFSASLPRAPLVAPPKARTVRYHRPARARVHGYERRASRASNRLPHNQRYIPPPPAMGYRR